MTIRNHISDPSSGLKAVVVDGVDENALVVATRPLKKFENKLLFFSNPDEGVDLNIDASTGGTPVKVHDGLDSSLWTASDVVGGGKTTFDSGEHAIGGIISVVDYSAIDAGDSFTINAVERVEGTDWDAEVDNDTTATNIAADITANVSGFTAEAVGAIVTVLSGGTDISTFESNADADEMTATGQSIKVDNSPVGDIFQLAGTDTDMGAYTSLSLWVYVDKDWKSGDIIKLFGWDTGTGKPVGDGVDLSNYFNYSSYDVWQKISIPLSDFGDLSSYATLDALRVQVVAAEGKSPKFYLDNIQFEESGTPIVYTLEPSKGTWLYVKSFQVILADALAGTLADSTMPYLAYNKLLGVDALAGGIVYKRIQEGMILSTFNIKQLSDFMGLSNGKISGCGSDGTNTWVSVNISFTDDVVLKYEEGDKMSLTISEDLSGLLLLRVGAGCKEELR